MFADRLVWSCFLDTFQAGTEDHPEMIWGARNIPQPALLKMMILYTWDGCLREFLEQNF